MKVENYSKFERFLSSLVLYNSLRLDRIEKVLAQLDNPQNKFPSIIVGGTAGKGSTATFLASILTQAGYKTGLYTSPHLEKLNERFKINNRQITDKELIDNGEALKKIINHLSYFEFLTTLAFIWFAAKKIDVAVLEVGMGGKFDATNVVSNKIALVTNVDKEHTQFLGKTVGKIAKEKVAILKLKGTLVTGVTQPPIIKLVKNFTRANKGKLLVMGKDFGYQSLRCTLKGSQFDFFAFKKKLTGLRTNLIGLHQPSNASLAIAAALQFDKKISVKAIRHGLTKAFIPGRLEIIKNVHTRCAIVLDGAHSPSKMAALRKSLQVLWPNTPITTIIAIKKDKDIKKIVGQVVAFSSHVVITRFTLDTDWGPKQAASPHSIASIARRLAPKKNIVIVPDPVKALKEAIKLNKKDGIILVTGSLYLVGEVRKMIKSPHGTRTKCGKTRIISFTAKRHSILERP